MICGKVTTTIPKGLRLKAQGNQKSDVWDVRTEAMKKTKNGGISRKERKKAKEIKQEDRPLLFVFFRFFRLKREFMLRFKCGVPVLASFGWGFAALGDPWLEFCGDIRSRAADHRTSESSEPPLSVMVLTWSDL